MENAHTQPAQDLREQEANNVAFRFMDSQNVMDDMEQELNADFSGVKLHTDSYADQVARSHGRDAVAKGKDIFFGAGMFDMQRPESRGLLAHELTHTMQQGVSGGAVQESAPTGAEQGGLISWFLGLFRGRTPQQAPEAEAAPLEEIAQLSPEEYLRQNDQITLSHANQAATSQFEERKQADPKLGIEAMDAASILNDKMPLTEKLQTNINAANALPNGGKSGDTMNYTSIAKLMGLKGPMDQNPLAAEETESRRYLLKSSNNPAEANNALTTEIAKYYHTLLKSGVSLQRLAEQKESILFDDEGHERHSMNKNSEIHSVAQGIFSLFSSYLQTPNIVEYIRLLSNQLGQAKVFGGNREATLNFVLEHLLHEYARENLLYTGFQTQMLEDHEKTAYSDSNVTLYTQDRKKLSHKTDLALDHVNTMVMNIFVQLPSLEKKGSDIPAELPPAAKEMVAQYKTLRNNLLSRIAVEPKLRINRLPGTLPSKTSEQEQGYYVVDAKTGKRVFHKTGPAEPTQTSQPDNSENTRPKYTIVREYEEERKKEPSKFSKELTIGGQTSSIQYDYDPDTRKVSEPPQNIKTMEIGGKKLNIVYSGTSNTQKKEAPPPVVQPRSDAPVHAPVKKPDIIYENGYNSESAPEKKQISVKIPGKNYSILIDADNEELKKKYGIT